MDIWVTKKNKNSTILNALKIQNLCFFEPKEVFVHTGIAFENVRLIILISSIEEIATYHTLLAEYNFLKIVVVLSVDLIEEAKIYFKSSKKKIEYYCFVEDKECLSKKTNCVYFFTNDIILYQQNSEVDYFWPDLTYSQEKFLNLNPPPQDKRSINVIPLNILNPDGCSKTQFGPIGTVFFSKQSYPDVKLDFSIIIPHYNNWIGLQITLRNLLEEIPKSKLNVEVIVVDDGSDDPERLNFLKDVNLNLIVLKMRRAQARIMGDCSFRAGMARNLGALYAKSESLLFIDCDISIDSKLMIDMAEALKISDLLMPQRLQLKTGIRKLYSEIESEDIDWGTMPYWSNFYKSTKDWNSVKSKWKYVSTYCLSVKKSLFMNLGAFSCSFVSYGCEDVDFGFRSHEQGVRFSLLQNKVYHVQPEKNRSEYNFDIKIKKQLLHRAYFYLYQVRHNQEIFNELILGEQSYVNDQRKITWA